MSSAYICKKRQDRFDCALLAELPGTKHGVALREAARELHQRPLADCMHVHSRNNSDSRTLQFFDVVPHRRPWLFVPKQLLGGLVALVVVIFTLEARLEIAVSVGERWLSGVQVIRGQLAQDALVCWMRATGAPSAP